MQLVVLAAGHGRRFGGLKQLAEVGPDGEAIMDYTARDALRAGFTEVVLIVRDEVEEELLEHIGRYWPAELKVHPVTQGPIAGTAQAVASAGPVVDGPFGMVNADDLYGPGAIRALARTLEAISETADHANIAYRLADTIVTDAPVTRGLCKVDGEGFLDRIIEHTVQRQDDGSIVGRPLRDPEQEMRPISTDEVVSMNLWGFSPGIFTTLEKALDAFDPDTAPHDDGKPPELLLPDVVGELVATGGGRVRVVHTEGRCIGITHPDDLPLVREMIADIEGEG